MGRDDILVHATAVVDPGAVVGEGTRVWHFSHVMAGAVIGKRCTLGQNVFVAGKVVIGDGVKVQNNVSVFEGVSLGDGVFLGPGVVFTNVSNPRAHLSRRGRFEKTRVDVGATIGANATVVCGNDIGAYALVGAGAVVTGAIPGHALAVGNPARQVGWVCRCGERLPDETLVCAGCGEGYRLDGDRLSPRTG